MSRAGSILGAVKRGVSLSLNYKKPPHQAILTTKTPPTSLTKITTQKRFAHSTKDTRPNYAGLTWNRTADAHAKNSAVFAHSVFSSLDPITTEKLVETFNLESSKDREYANAAKILKKELKESPEKEKMQGVLNNIAKSCLTFCDSEFYANSKEGESEEMKKAIKFIKEEQKKLPNQEILLSKYYPINGKEEIRIKVAKLLEEKRQEVMDPELLVLTNSYAQAKHYADSVGGKAFGLDNNFITTGFVICENTDQANEVKKLFNLAMVSGSVINQLALIHCLENGIELTGNQTNQNKQTTKSIDSLKKQTIKYLTRIYPDQKIKKNKVFFGIGAQNFVDKISAFLKKSGYENIIILESPYHLYEKTIKLLNDMNPIMAPVTDDLRTSPKFLKLSLEDQYEKWQQQNTGPDAIFKIAFLNNEPGNPSGYKSTTKESQEIANVMNQFASKKDVEFTYISDGAYKVLYGGDAKYITDFLDSQKVNIINFESHSKSHWTFARLGFCVMNFKNPSDEALQILEENEPQNLSYYIISLAAMKTRLERKEPVPQRAQEMAKAINDALPSKLTHIKADVYPFVYLRFPRYLNQVSPKNNPEFRMEIVKNIFSAKLSNEQLSQTFNLDIDEIEGGKLKIILGNFHNQIFNQKEVDFLIDRMIEKEMSIEDRVSVLCDSLAPKSQNYKLSKESENLIHKNIFELRTLESSQTKKALVKIKQIMEEIGVNFDENCNLSNEVGVNNFLNKVDEELEKKDCPIGFINCRNTLFTTLFAMNASKNICGANIGIGNRGRISSRPAFAGMSTEKISKMANSIGEFLQDLQPELITNPGELKKELPITTIQEQVKPNVIQEQGQPNIDLYMRRHAFQNVNQQNMQFIQQSLDTALNSFLQEPQYSANIYSSFMTKLVDPIVKTAKSLKENKVTEGSLENLQKDTRVRLNLLHPKLFAIFSIIDEKGNIIEDGKYGKLNISSRQENNIPSLEERDYVRQIYDNGHKEFVCGSPVTGSTSGKFMIPAGIRIDENRCLTFGIDVEGLVKNMCTPQVTQKYR